MLIIAQPKSASTSLAHSLALITGTKTTREAQLKSRKNKEFASLPHSDMGMLKEVLILKWVNDRSTYYQQHLTPYSHNLDILRKNKCRCIVTSRNVDDSFEAYFRQPDLKRHFDKMLKHHGEEAIKKAKNQLQTFKDKYEQEAKTNSNILIISYDKMIQHPSQIMNLILEFYNEPMRVGNDFEWLKYRYTGGGTVNYKYKA